MRPNPAVVLLPLLLFIAGVPVFAQPNPFGCHFHHGQSRPMAPLNAGQRSDIQATIARSDTFDILHYDIQLDVTDYGGQRIVGVTTVRAKALMPDQVLIRFDLLGLQVDSVEGENGILSHAYDGEFLTVYMDEAPPVEEEFELTVYYRGVPQRDPQWGGFYFESNYIYNLGIGISTIAPNFGKVWYPCFDSFVERATYAFHVKSAGTFRFHGQGTFLGEVALAGDTVIRSYALDQRIPTHVSAIAVADYSVHEYTHEAANGTLPVTLKAKAANLNNMVARFEQLPDAIDACEFWYGPYPYERVGYVITTDGALEIPTNIAYPQHMTTQSVYNNRALFTHELGHMWWGDMVTPHIHNDMWLKEGPAEYSGHLIEEWLGGPAALMREVKNNMLYVLRQAHVEDDGFQALSPMPDLHIYGLHTYYKGAAVLHNLRGYLGDVLFRQAMLTLQEELAHTTITALGFKEALEGATGVDMDPFFDAWVFAPGYSVFEVQSMVPQASGGQWSVDLGISQKLRGTSQYHLEVPLDVTFWSATGFVHEAQIVAGGEWTDLSVNVPFEPAMVALNRHARLNQARMDHEVTIIPGQAHDPILPYVELRLYADNTVDTTFTRVEHIWAAPDQGPLGADITAISGTHYWTLDGRLPEGTVLRSRMTYSGTQPNALDHALVAGNEAGICVVFRPDASSAWEVCPGQVVTAGSLTNGSGFIVVNDMRKGQYAFAKATAIVGMEESMGMENGIISLFPVPAVDLLTVAGTFPYAGTLVFDVLGADGRILQRSTEAARESFRHVLDVQGLANGAYLLRIMTTDGHLVGTERFEVMR